MCGQTLRKSCLPCALGVQCQLQFLDDCFLVLVIDLQFHNLFLLSFSDDQIFGIVWTVLYEWYPQMARGCLLFFYVFSRRYFTCNRVNTVLRAGLPEMGSLEHVELGSLKPRQH